MRITMEFASVGRPSRLCLASLVRVVRSDSDNRTGHHETPPAASLIDS